MLGIKDKKERGWGKCKARELGQNCLQIERESDSRAMGPSAKTKGTPAGIRLSNMRWERYTVVQGVDIRGRE